MIRASAVDAPSGKDDDGVYAQDGDGIAHEEGLKGEEATLVASLESDPEEGSYDVDEGAGDLVTAEELSLDEEYSDKIAVGMNDVATAISEEEVVQDKNVDSANVGHHVEDNNQEVSHVSDIALKEADLLLPQRWERASRATASNKLVEEGLHRLQRRDAVVEETSGDKSFKEAVLKLIHMIRKRVSTSFASRHTKKVMPVILTSLGVGLSLLVSSNNANGKSPDGAVQTYEFQSINNASQDNPHIALSGAEELVEEDDASPVPEL